MKLRLLPLLLAVLLLSGCTASQEPNTEGSSAVVHITDETFDEIVLSSDKTVLLDFYADWCGPCKQMAPILDEIAAENADIVVGKIDVDSEFVLTGQFKIEAMPTLVVIQNGEEIARAVGYRSKDAILAMLQP